MVQIFLTFLALTNLEMNSVGWRRYLSHISTLAIKGNDNKGWLLLIITIRRYCSFQILPFAHDDPHSSARSNPGTKNKSLWFMICGQLYHWPKASQSKWHKNFLSFHSLFQLHSRRTSLNSNLSKLHNVNIKSIYIPNWLSLVHNLIRSVSWHKLKWKIVIKLDVGLKSNWWINW